LSRALYAYRSAHFVEGHAASGFDTILAFLARHERDARLSEDTALSFWAWKGNQRYRTYKACLFAVADFVAVTNETGERTALASALDVNDPALARVVASSATDPLDAIEEELTDWLEAGGEAADDPEARGRGIGALQDHGLRLYTRQEIELLATLFELGAFAEDFPLAVLRFYAFHPIQSGLSNELRTGRARVPVEERLTCREAEPYPVWQARFAGLAEKTRQWLQVAYGLRTEVASDVNVAVRDRGLATLAASRAKTLLQGRPELRLKFAAAEPGLIYALSRIEQFLAALERGFSQRGIAALEQFESDRQRFSDVLRSLYGITQEEAPG
jgi:hypothetical protein